MHAVHECVYLKQYAEVYVGEVYTLYCSRMRLNTHQSWS